MENNTWEIISENLISQLSYFFEDRIKKFEVLNQTNMPYTMFRIEFCLYNYTNIILNYDRGRFGCSVINGNKYISLQGSQKWYDQADLSIFCEELDNQVKLRIPDKYLNYYGWL